MKLYDNQWGFSVQHSNPFQVFPLLQEVARENVGGDEMIDLSRGDPGYGFAPSMRGREFLSFLLFLDTKLNNAKRLFIHSDKTQENQILEEIAVMARSAYVPALAERYLRDLSEFIQRAVLIGAEQEIEWTAYDVLYQIFKCSTVSGGTYHSPQGELLVRAVVAWWHKQTVQTPLDADDVIFTAGASHAIGTLFKLLGQEGIQYLTTGDKVVIASPVYAPYNTIMENRGLDVVSISINPQTGKLENDSIKMIGKLKNVKALLIIDPNNPTGFTSDESTMSLLANFAKEQDALVITDEVYSSFFGAPFTDEPMSMVDLCPDRTVRIQARSKIERSTGLRFGDVLITKATNKYLTEELFKGLLPEGRDFKTAFIFAKGPGGVNGEFQHTTFIPGPAQILGAAHILLGEEEREKYRAWLRQNMEVFSETLGVNYASQMYYLMFDMNGVPGCTQQEVAPEEKITELAKLGVVVLPANQFFSEADRKKADRSNMVRVSLANASPEKVKRAAEVIRSYLTS